MLSRTGAHTLTRRRPRAAAECVSAIVVCVAHARRLCLDRLACARHVRTRPLARTRALASPCPRARRVVRLSSAWSRPCACADQHERTFALVGPRPRVRPRA
eukprot:6174669-Pleurochrysis_carterae.AAC.2